VVEGARLESVYRGNSIQGSNPCLSAMNFTDLKVPKKWPARLIFARHLFHVVDDELIHHRLAGFQLQAH
jgi:hypothetical protein